MKFAVQREDIHQAVAAVQRATATRVIQPILSNILIESTSADTLKLSATDLDFAIETTIPAKVVEEGRITLSAKKLAEIISKLAGGREIEFEIEEAVQTARIKCGTALFDMRTLPADEFPQIKQIDASDYLEVDGKAFIRAINQTAFAAASYDANNVLGGVFFQLNENGLEMAATDGSRLARRIEAVSEGGVAVQLNVSAIIPAKALQEFLKLCASDVSEQPVRLAIQEGQISFRTPRFYVLSRLLDGQYPKYNQLIPAENKIVAFANKKMFIDSLERTAVMANERTNIVKLSLDNNNMSLAAQTPDVGDSKDTMDVVYDGDTLNIAFNYKYVIDALKVIESEDIRMETNGPLSPTIFKGKEDNGYLCLVMPVQVK
ncbi:DNA polymerase III subunit beta [Vampirovibrio sp.]|uniref:DNA polymerase III subunit beta n=1 Tax=Vampirovibrio sp. TaxID=2717857 RepID=UPI0035938B76